jgi:gamma-glutamylputrescine oxidase
MTAVAPWGLSFWLDFERPRFPSLEGNLTTEVAIIGGGIAGLKLAHFLNRRGIEVAILEGGRVGDGASGRNQGSLNHGPGFGYAECIARHSHSVARQLWQLGLANHELMRAQLAEYEVDCDYQVEGFWFLAREDMPDHEATLAAYRTDFELLVEDGFEVEWLDCVGCQERGGNRLYTGGFGYLTDAQFHSGKYVAGLARGIAQRPGVQLFEQARVVQVERNGTGAIARLTNGRTVEARHIFLAVNALAPQFVRSLEPALRAERGQVLVTAPLVDRPCRGSFGTALAWWREIVEADGRWRLLFGGGRTRETPDSLFAQFEADGSPSERLETEGFRPSVEHQARLDAQFAILFPQLRGVEITHRWGGLQSFTADCLPVIGEFDPDRRIHGMAGFSGRGNCFADVGAEYIAGRLTGEPGVLEQKYGGLFESVLKVGRPSAEWGSPQKHTS